MNTRPLNRDRKGAGVSTYLITFACYGTWLPGQAGAVDRDHNVFGGPLPEASALEESRTQRRTHQAPYSLDSVRRDLVLRSLQEVWSYRGWTLLAAHVRTNHVHTVIAADQTPERVMNTLKSYASRALNEVDSPGRQTWARHGSTRYLWTAEAIAAVVKYVVSGQGEPMAVHEQPLCR
jgi:REP element-mobilizing transposase RayT